ATSSAQSQAVPVRLETDSGGGSCAMRPSATPSTRLRQAPQESVPQPGAVSAGRSCRRAARWMRSWRRLAAIAGPGLGERAEAAHEEVRHLVHEGARVGIRLDLAETRVAEQ